MVYIAPAFFKDKAVLITGASGGLGEEMALQCARAGAKVALLARRQEKLEELAAACKAEGAACAVAVRCDVVDRDMCARAVATAAAALGGKLDVVVLNAGMSQGCYFEDIKSLDDADYLMSLNVTGTLNITHYALPLMPKQESSRLVFVASVAGTAGVPFRTVYCASKWAVIGFANALRVELMDAYGASSPKVVVTCPPEVKTDLNSSRMQFGAGTPAESIPEVQKPCGESVAFILRGIAGGKRTQYFGCLPGILATMYACFPSLLDKLVLKKVKKTTKANGQGR